MKTMRGGLLARSMLAGSATALFASLLFTPVGSAATFNVTNSNDSGAGSLRIAVIQTQAASGADTIVFSLSPSGQTITLQSGLPLITQELVIDGGGVIVDGFGISPGLTISGANLTLQDITVRGAAGSGGTGGTFGATGSTGGPGLPGGTGGVGGPGGAGGGGAVGMTATSSTLTNGGTIAGGAGGAGGMGGTGGMGGSGTPAGSQGPGGDGGAGGTGGIGLTGSNLTLVNTGTIRGGNGGMAGVGGVGGISGALGNAGSGGIGIEGSDLAITNSGTIRGGLTGGSSIRAAAIHFTGGTNSLTLEQGFTILGDVLAVAGGNDTLALGGSGQGSFDLTSIGAQYQNFSNFTKTGTGTWELFGTGPGTTDWTVTDGVLQIGSASDAATVLGDIDVQSGGTLSGYQTITGTVSNNGTVWPGSLGTDPSDVGTLTVLGGYSQGSAAALGILVTPGNGASRLAVLGTAHLGGELRLAFAPGFYSRNTYTIVTSTGLSGTFGTVTDGSGGAYSVNYDLNNVSLVLNSGTSGGGPTVVAPQNGQIFGATTSIMVLGAQASNRALFGHLNDRRLGVSDDNLRTAFAGSNPNQLAFAGDLAGLNAVLAELPQALARHGGWFRATGGFGSIDAAGPDLDSYGGGFMAGYDRQMTDNLLLGAAVGFNRTQIDLGDSSASINTPRVTLYGSYQYRHLALDVSIGYGFDRIKTRDNSAGGTAKAKHDAHEIVAAVQAGYAVDLPSSFVLTPRVGVDYLHIFEEGFTENGAGAFDLTTKSGDTDSLKPNVGVTLAKTFATDNGWLLTPQFHLTYRREMLDAAHDAQVVVGGGAFTVKGVKPTRDELALGTSLTAQLSETVDVYGGYTAQLPIGNTVSHNFDAGLRVAF